MRRGNPRNLHTSFGNSGPNPWSSVSVAVALATRGPPTAFERSIHRLGLMILRLTIFLTLFVLLMNLAFARPALDHGAGLVALAAGSTGAARRALEAAVAGWDARGRVWEASWARLDLAAALTRTNRHATAVALAGQVRETAERLGSTPLAERADELLRHGRGRIVELEPWHPLTAREFEVARLIADGHTNAEIADALGIAPKTASAHVEHILAKLGASRRAEIARWAGGVDLGKVSVA